jgi:hypothetical protein
MTEGKFMLLPPAPGVCQICATEHEEAEPHNRESTFYQLHFYAQWQRSPTWADAMLHCPEDIKQDWLNVMRANGLSEAELGL